LLLAKLRLAEVPLGPLSFYPTSNQNIRSESISTQPQNPSIIKPLTRDVAAKLAQSRDALRLDMQTELSAEAAEELAKHDGGRLFLGGLTELSDAAAEALAKHRGSLHLPGLKSLSDKAAEALTQHQGSLNLSGLTTLTDRAAEALAAFKGGALPLLSLKQLSGSAAHALRRNPDVELPPRFR